MARHVIPRCRHLTAVSPNLAEDIRKLARVPVHVVANPIPTEVMSARGCAAGAFDAARLLMVQNGWMALKNGAAALRAFAIARRSRPELKLSCFGKDWEEGGPAHRWAAPRGLGDAVEFRGPVPHGQVLAEMQQSTAMIHPSRWESCCMAIAEAMSLGLPVVAGRDAGGVGWQLDRGRAGILVDVTDPRDIARGILTVTGEFAAWREISSAARHRAREIFAMDRVVDEYVTLYESVRRDAQDRKDAPRTG
jgi:glycosyltransferase involved in cell wall biosynthesis